MSGCAGQPPGNVELDFSNYPPDWPGTGVEPVQDGVCLPVTGSFSSKGESNSEIAEQFKHPIFEQAFFGESGIANDSNFFTVGTNAELRELNFEIFDKGGASLESGLTKKFTNCENGWLKVESYVSGGSGDNPTKSSYRKTTYGLAEDGSFLINTYSEVVVGKWFVGEEVRTSDIWYRFLPAR